MAGLRPIGSEKLEGMEKINRIMEIARYNENTPTPINETKSTEYDITLADGRNYQIVKERNGYVIKRTLTESVNEYEYMEPMKNRRYYSSYSQAFKRLNLVAKEVNINEGYDKNISLFNEGDEDKKYILKLSKEETNEQAAPASAPAPVPAPQPQAQVPTPAPVSAPEEDVVEPEMDDMDIDMEDEVKDEENDEEVTFKTIQKLTGKLAQKIRTFNSDEENKMDSKDIKYVINSVLSSLELENLDEDDKESIVDKLEGVEEDNDMEGMDDEMDTEMDDMEGEEVTADVPPAPEGEMAEDFDFEDEEDYPKHTRRRHYYDDITDHESKKIGDMLENIFSESKVEKVIDKYIDKKPVTETKKSNKNVITESIGKLSVNTPQQFASLKVIEKYPNAKFLGKTVSNHLVFEAEDKKISVSPKGGYKLL